MIVNNEIEAVKYYHWINIENPQLVLDERNDVLVGSLDDALMFFVHPESPRLFEPECYLMMKIHFFVELDFAADSVVLA